MKPILFLRALGQGAVSFPLQPTAGAVVSRRVYDLPELDLQAFGAILVSAHTDQRALAACDRQLVGFLDAGGVLVFNGHLAYPFLPELQVFVPVDGRGLGALQVRRCAEHPVFDGVDPKDLTFRRGVAGFYGRGSNPPPPGAEVLHTLSGSNAPLDWLWQRPGGGLVFMHAGNDLWMYSGDSSSAARMTPQLLAWLFRCIAGNAERRRA